MYCILWFLLAGSAYAEDNRGTVVASINDEKFVIETRWGNQLFEARTYCFDTREDDKVMFLKPTGVCTSNTFINLRSGKECRVWCE